MSLYDRWMIWINIYDRKLVIPLDDLDSQKEGAGFDAYPKQA